MPTASVGLALEGECRRTRLALQNRFHHLLIAFIAAVIDTHITFNPPSQKLPAYITSLCQKYTIRTQFESFLDSA